MRKRTYTALEGDSSCVSTGGVGTKHVFQQNTKHKAGNATDTDTSLTDPVYVREGGVQQTLGSPGYDGHVGSLGPVHSAQNQLLDAPPQMDENTAPITTIHNLVGTSEIFSSIQPIDLEYVYHCLPNSFYDRKRFAAITIRVTQPVCTGLL
jgi:hypothetical protein